MTYTLILILIQVGLLIANLLISAWLLKIGLRWIHAEDDSFRNAFEIVAVSTLFFYAILASTVFVVTPETPSELIQIGLTILPIAAYFFGVKILVGASVGRSLKALIPTIAAPLFILLLVLLVFRPFVYEMFEVPSNSMAPTIRGNHLVSECPECGDEAICSGMKGRPGVPNKRTFICSNFHTFETEPAQSQALEGDRIVISKLLSPKRWDLATFKLPSDPNVSYVMRVVGLPGETIYIDDEGKVFANDKLIPLPDELAGLRYADKEAIERQRFMPLHGTKSNPAKLDSNEYFVLGDFSERSLDSRFWKSGAPRQNPYAVPEENFTGVVTTIYWPPKRWRSFK